MKPNTVFLDSDGVLADFSGYCVEHYGRLPESIVDAQEKKKFWEWVTIRNETEPFFYSLKKTDCADELVEFCTKNFQSVKILTASGHTPKDVGDQKKRWYARHYPSLEVIITRKSTDKARYANASSILIDDRDASITPWKSAGGIGILHVSLEDTIMRLRTFL